MSENKSLEEIRRIARTISPVFVSAKKTSIRIGLSNDFLVFQFLKNMIKRIENEPYLNFISLLKFYKVFGKLMHGPISEIYRDRNKRYFKHFFENIHIYELIKNDLEWVYLRNKNLLVTINKKGYIIYDNYKKNKFNILLLTIHSGTWIPADIAQKQTITNKERLLEEDIDIHKIYGPLVLNHAGIWIDNKLSRFACDYNRSPEKSIYTDGSERWIKKLWKKQLSSLQLRKLMKGYDDFYLTLTSLVDSYHFNIILDGHSMKDATDRAELSFGTKYIPKFYMPVVRSLKRRLMRLGYKDVAFDKPFRGGYILEWLRNKFPNVFICSMEINKKLYMSKSRTASHARAIDTLSQNLVKIFAIE